MSVYCELNDVIQQIRYKTQIFYETFKRDSIAEQIYNFSNESTADIDPDVQYSKSLDKDYSCLYKPITSQPSTPNLTTPGTTTPASALSPPQQPQQNNNNNNNKPTTATTASTVTSPATTTASSCTSGTTQTTSSSSSTTVTSTNTSTMSSLTSTDASASSSAFSQQPQNNNNNTNNTTQQQPQNNNTQQQQQQQQNNNSTQPSTSPKKCKIVTFTGTSVKLNKPINGKDNNSNSNSNNSNNNNNNNNNKTNIVPDKTVPANTTTSPQQQAQQPDKSSNEPVFVFVKEKVVKGVPPQQTSESLLTRLVRPNDESHDYGDIIPPPLGPGMSLKILVANLNQSVNIKVVEKATILQTIVATLRAFHSSGGTGLPSSDPKAYHIRIGDTNGKIDKDCPPLDLNGYINKFKEETLLLCLNPKFDLKKSSSSLSMSGGIQAPQSSSTSSSTSSTSSNVNNSNNNNNNNNNSNGNNNLKASTGGINIQQQQPQQSQAQLQQQNSQAQLQQQNSQAQLQQQNSQSQLQPPQQTSEGGSTHHHNYRTHHRSVSSGPDAPLVVKITLPDSSITKVVFQKTMLLKDLLESTCKKRKLLVADHYFTLENGRLCDGMLPMEKLGGADLILVSKRPIEVTTLSPLSDTDSNGSDLQQEIFWYDALAWQYKTYEVTKLKKYNISSKQERIIGIDKERITNMSPKDTETKRPARLIKDISKVALLEKPKYFTIEYNDGKSYIYEAKTTSIANEIVGKISYILGKN